jgi:hypothetical protein
VARTGSGLGIGARTMGSCHVVQDELEVMKFHDDDNLSFQVGYHMRIIL